MILRGVWFHRSIMCRRTTFISNPQFHLYILTLWNWTFTHMSRRSHTTHLRSTIPIWSATRLPCQNRKWSTSTSRSTTTTPPGRRPCAGGDTLRTPEHRCRWARQLTAPLQSSCTNTRPNWLPPKTWQCHSTASSRLHNQPLNHTHLQMFSISLSLSLLLLFYLLSTSTVLVRHVI